MRSTPPSCSAAAPGSRPWPSSPAAPPPRESAWVMPGRSSPAIEALRRARRRPSARPASRSRKPPTRSSACSSDGGADFCREGNSRRPAALFRVARRPVGVAGLHARLFHTPGGPRDCPAVSVLLLHRTPLSLLRRNALVRVHVAGRSGGFREALSARPRTFRGYFRRRRGTCCRGGERPHMDAAFHRRAVARAGHRSCERNRAELVAEGFRPRQLKSGVWVRSRPEFDTFCAKRVYQAAEFPTLRAKRK